METICTKIRLCRCVSHNKCWSDLTWPDLAWPDLASYSFEAKIWQPIQFCDVTVTWPDLVYIWNFAHICVIWSHTKFCVAIATRFRVIAEKPKGEGQKMSPNVNTVIGSISINLLLTYADCPENITSKASIIMGHMTVVQKGSEHRICQKTRRKRKSRAFRTGIQ